MRKRGLSPFLAILLSVALAASAHASGVSVHIEKDRITVTGEGFSPDGRFELVFTRGATGISEWYDLDRDPKRLVNLAAHGSDNRHALFQNMAEMLDRGTRVSVFPDAAERFEVVEENAVRAVVETSGVMTTPTGEWPDEKIDKGIREFTGHKRLRAERPKYVTRFTVYSTGRIYIRHELEFKGLPLAMASNRMVMATAPDVTVKALNDHRDEMDAFTAPAGFVLHHGDGDAFHASALFVPGHHRYPTEWLGQMMSTDKPHRGWVRSAFSVQDEPGGVPPGKYGWHFLLQIEPSNIDSRASAQLVVRDYRVPAKTAFVGNLGKRLVRDVDDVEGDAFAERRGCYTADATGAGTIAMSFDSGALTRFHPVIEVHGWPGDVPGVIHVDDATRRRDVHYIAAKSEKVLLLQLYGALGPGMHTLNIGNPDD